MKLGEIQELEIVKITENGVYLSDPKNQIPDAAAGAEVLDVPRVLLPRNQVPKDAQLGMTVKVFLYKDSEDRPIATTSIPPVTLGGLAVLPVKEVTKIGAFLSWGLAKDLFLPFKEQIIPVKQGDAVLIALYVDKSQRLCATTRVYNYLRTDSSYKVDDKVGGIVYELIDSFGAFVAVDSRYSAMIPKQELFRPLKVGEYIEARVSTVHEDGKLALSLREKAYVQLPADAEEIYKKLVEAGGFLPYHDKTDPEIIRQEFALSKNAYKRAIGHLMKDGRITISDTGIRAVGTGHSDGKNS